jgi:uncharacterized protein (DUF2336 family)
MDVTDLQDDNSVMPVLVKLFDTQKIYTLAEDKDSNARAELTAIVTSLLEMNLSARESELVADVLISLMRQLELDVRLSLSERLASMKTVPVRLALHMANDEISVAAPVLKQNPVFTDMDLIYIIKSKPAEYWRAIAARAQLNDAVMNMLADTKDLDTAITLLENENIVLTPHTLDVMTDMAQGRDALAKPLIHRSEMSADIAAKLYTVIGDELKEELKKNFQIEDSVKEAVDDVIIDFVEATNDENLESLPSENHIAMAKRYSEQKSLSPILMIRTLQRGQYKSFLAQFALYVDLPISLVDEMAKQESGQGLAVAARACGINRNDFVSLYLLLTRIRNKGGMMDSKDLSRATRYYDNLSRTIAEGVLDSYREKVKNDG